MCTKPLSFSQLHPPHIRPPVIAALFTMFVAEMFLGVTGVSPPPPPPLHVFFVFTLRFIVVLIYTCIIYHSSGLGFLNIGDMAESFHPFFIVDIYVNSLEKKLKIISKASRGLVSLILNVEFKHPVGRPLMLL